MAGCRVNLDEVFATTRAAFPEPTPPGRMLELLTVVLGDAARLLRGRGEGGPLDREELARELGNLVLTALRLVDDLGQDVPASLAVAAASHVRYAERLRKAA